MVCLPVLKVTPSSQLLAAPSADTEFLVMPSVCCSPSLGGWGVTGSVRADVELCSLQDGGCSYSTELEGRWERRTAILKFRFCHMKAKRGVECAALFCNARASTPCRRWTTGLIHPGCSSVITVHRFIMKKRNVPLHAVHY